MLGVGLVAGGAGYFFNDLGSETRRGYDEGKADCAAGLASCDREKVNQLAGEINDAKLPLALMYGTAALSALLGTTFVALDLVDGLGDAQASLRLSPHEATVVVSWR